MALQKLYEMQSKYEKERLAELERVKARGAEKGYQNADRVDFSLSDYWFSVEIYSADGRIYGHYFSCQSLDALKEAITWIVSETKFYEVTAFVKDKAHVTFRDQGDIDTFDNYYREYFCFAEDVRETFPELTERAFTKEQMEQVYEKIIGRKEYPQFDDWLHDMCRSGLAYRCHRKFVPTKKEAEPDLNCSNEKADHQTERAGEARRNRHKRKNNR